MKQYSIAVAVFAGFCVVALAIFFGLQAQNAPGSSTVRPTADLTLSETEQTEWLSPTEVGETPKVPDVLRKVDDSGTTAADVHNEGTFNTAWRAHRDDIAKRCRATSYAAVNDGNWFAEIPLELKISDKGVVIAARRFAKFREVGSDGAYHDAKLNDEAQAFLTECYTRAIVQRIRFPRASTSSELKVWVRMVSTVD